MTKYAIQFIYPAAPADDGTPQVTVNYAGKAPDGALGWAPTTETAFQFDSAEAAETMLRNGYGGLADIAGVVEV